MGEPRQPTAADRAATQQLASRVVTAVEADVPWPDDIYTRTLVRRDTEDFAFQLCQEIRLLMAERDEARAAIERHGVALYYLRIWKGNDQHQSNAEEIAAGNMVMGADCEAAFATKESP